jgi:hypothetical protein
MLLAVVLLIKQSIIATVTIDIPLFLSLIPIIYSIQLLSSLSLLRPLTPFNPLRVPCAIDCPRVKYCSFSIPCLVMPFAIRAIQLVNKLIFTVYM